MKRIAIDAGGTFTDGVLWDDETGIVRSVKVSSDNGDPSQAVLAAVEKLEDIDSVKYLMHGTTVATNAAIEGSGPRVGLICTKGFRDVLEIARLMRLPEQLYQIRTPPAPSLVRRRDRIEIGGRIDHRGEETEPLDEDQIVAAAETFRKRGINAVAIAFLHSYANDSHERRAKAILEREMPGASISASSAVLPEFREYERTSTTVLNSYLMPVIGGYLNRLRDKMKDTLPEARLWAMQSSGGVASVEKATATPVSLLLSGPSGGIVAGRHLIDQVGLSNAITMDMGGTSYDVCLLHDRTIPMAHERQVQEMPVKVPSVDILTIGAGGGSIGWIDAAGQFQVGPKSAKAYPGPACYGRGGEEPTVTDANLVLGVLGKDQKLGGEVSLDVDAAYKACERLGAKLGMSAIEAAWGIRRLINTTMAGATRAVSVGKGYDPRDFALISFGGAGPMHAADIAQELEIPDVLIPSVPGCYSAVGLAVSDVTHDYVQTFISILSPDLESRLGQAFAELTGNATAELDAEQIASDRRDIFPALEVRYLGEQFSITVPVPSLDSGWVDRAMASFHQAHERLYGFKAEEEPIELVNMRLSAVGRLYRGDRPRRPANPTAGTAARVEPAARRPVYFGPSETDKVDVPVFGRAQIAPGGSFSGPSIIEQEDTTIVIPPRMSARSDEYGNLWIGAAR